MARRSGVKEERGARRGELGVDRAGRRIRGADDDTLRSAVFNEAEDDAAGKRCAERLMSAS
jgi:hypothetical protein